MKISGFLYLMAFLSMTTAVFVTVTYGFSLPDEKTYARVAKATLLTGFGIAAWFTIMGVVTS